MLNTKESLTAKFCSFARAYHSNFDRNKIFDDYLAFDIMGKEEYDEVKKLINEVFAKKDTKKISTAEILQKFISPILLPRIAYGEKALCEFSTKHKQIQYVISGAGMDTFAFRNTNKNIKIFELDFPSTQKYKLSRIKELMWNIPENLKFVPIDFERDDMKELLLQAGFDANLPTFFSIMGVTYYLNEEAFEMTIKNISEISKGETEIVFDYPDETTFETERSKFLAEITEKLGEPMKKGFEYSTMKAITSEYGFEVKNKMSPYDIKNKYGKTEAYENVHFMTIRKG